MINEKVASRLIFCGNPHNNYIIPDNNLDSNENSKGDLPGIESTLDYWYPMEQRSISSLLEEFEFLLERARLLDLVSRPFLEFVNSVLIYLYRQIQRNGKYKECLEQLVRDAYLECIKLPKEEGLNSKIITDLSQFVAPKLNIRGIIPCDCDEAIDLANSYFKKRGISKPDIQAKVEQIEMLENKILISDMQALGHIPLLCDRYIDWPTTDSNHTDKLTGFTCTNTKHALPSTTNSTLHWSERNDFITYIKSTNANLVKLIRCAISSTPIHCVWIFTTGQLNFGTIKTSKSAFQPILDMVPLANDTFTWSQFSAMKDKIQLLYPLERLPEFTKNNYIDGYFKILPQVENFDGTNYSPLKIKIVGQDGFKFDANELKISTGIEKGMINYINLEDQKYELSKVCGVVTLKADITEDNKQVIIDKNCYPSITPRYTISLNSNVASTIQISDLLDKCAEFGIKNLTFIVESCNLAYTLAKSLCVGLEKRAQFNVAPWYNKYFGIHIHIMNKIGRAHV